jgi:hypothetical protein
MTFRPSFAFVALAALSAPFAAFADAPSGDIDAIFAIDQAVKVSKPQFSREQYSTYIEGQLPTVVSNKSRDEVRKDLVSMPVEAVGA